MTVTINTYLPLSNAIAENRCVPRIRLSIPATLRPAGGRGFSVTVTDISLAGFSCDAVTGSHVGTRCWLSLPSTSGLQAEIIWNDGSNVGCAFSNMLHPAVLDTLLARFKSSF